LHINQIKNGWNYTVKVHNKGAETSPPLSLFVNATEGVSITSVDTCQPSNGIQGTWLCSIVSLLSGAQTKYTADLSFLPCGSGTLNATLEETSTGKILATKGIHVEGKRDC